MSNAAIVFFIVLAFVLGFWAGVGATQRIAREYVAYMREVDKWLDKVVHDMRERGIAVEDKRKKLG